MGFEYLPCIQVLSSYLSELDDRDLLDKHWAKDVRREHISTPIYVQHDKMYQLKVRSEAWEHLCILSDLDILLEQSENANPARKKSVQGIKVARYDESYTIYFGRLIRCCGLVVSLIKARAASWVAWVRWALGNASFCHPSAILRGTELTVHWHVCIYIATFPLICLSQISLVAISQWQGFNS